MDTGRTIVELRARLAKAESDRDTWRAARLQENYLAACSMIDALDMQIAQLEGVARATAEAADPADAPARQAAELCITFNGRHYGYRGYRYDRFSDAVDYARLDRSCPFGELGVDDSAHLESFPLPNAAELVVMRALGITFVDGVFHWREYRYDRLADAVAYAGLVRP